MIKFTEEQLKAINIANEYLDGKINKDYITISGQAGTGKTTILREIIKNFNYRIIIGGAVSHAASRVLNNSIQIPTMSLAKMLNKKRKVDNFGNIKFETSIYGEIPITKADIIIIDECSMIDKEELNNILKYRKANSKLIFVGDMAQLPPINNENNKISPTFDNTIIELNKVMRSQYPLNIVNDYFRKIIIDNILNNKSIPHSILSRKIEFKNEQINDKGIFTVRNINNFIKIFKHHYKNNNPNSCKIIAYKNKTIDYYNKAIRESLFGDNLKHSFVEGDMILSQSNYFIDDFNMIQNNTFFTVVKVKGGIQDKIPCYYLDLINEFGNTYKDIPVIDIPKGYKIYKSIKEKLKKEAEKNKKAIFWKKYYNFIESFAYFTFGYAITSHKAQGQTIENVIVFAQEIKNVMPIMSLEKLQSIYVATSRASHNIYIY